MTGSSPARWGNGARASSGRVYGVVLVGLACWAGTASAQAAPPSFAGFAAGDVTAEAFAASVVQPGMGSGVALPLTVELASTPDRQLARAQATLHAVVPVIERCATPPRPSLPPALVDMVASLRALRADDALARGDLSVLYAEGDLVAFQRQLGDARRVVAFNRADAERFLPLPEAGGDEEGAVPSPLTPVFASGGELSEIPALVAIVDEDRGELVYGLRIPARTVVIFRPVEPRDVRPNGLDE